MKMGLRLGLGCMWWNEIWGRGCVVNFFVGDVLGCLRGEEGKGVLSFVVFVGSGVGLVCVVVVVWVFGSTLKRSIVRR